MNEKWHPDKWNQRLKQANFVVGQRGAGVGSERMGWGGWSGREANYLRWGVVVVVIVARLFVDLPLWDSKRVLKEYSKTNW